MKVMKYPFEVPYTELEDDLDSFVDAIFSRLDSDFLVMPKGQGFVEYPVFEQGYEALKQATSEFCDISPAPILQVVLRSPVALIVLRAMLGFTPPEWAYLATRRTGVSISQGAVRTLDRKIRLAPATPIPETGVTAMRISALVETACQVLNEGIPEIRKDRLHRLDKADTKSGIAALQGLARVGVPYAMLLYERFLGRPFAGHRDSISELKGDVLESAIEDVLTKSGISYRKTKRAQKIEGFPQAPDFIIPSEFIPQIIIEAKITEDDGTARDKVARIQQLDTYSKEGQPENSRKYQVVACIAGRGFGVRREDMKKLLLATRGKVFTLQNLDELVPCTRLQEFQTIRRRRAE